MMRFQNNRLTLVAFYTILTLLLGFLENFIPIFLPGIKLGLANVGIILAIYTFDFSFVFLLVFLKSFLISIITGNFFVKFVIGFSATLFSAFIMSVYYGLTKKLSSPISTGALGAYSHMFIQLVIIKFFFIKQLAIFNVFPYLSLISLLTGVVTGLISYKILVTLNLKERVE